MPDDRRVLEGVDRLVVDGMNVLYALRRSPAQLPAAALIGRLRAIVPPGVAVVVVLDGSPEQGLVSRRVASGVEVRYSGRSTADEVITRLAEHELGSARAGLLVVTDDIELGAAVRRSGGRTVRNSWLIDRLGRQRLSAPSAGGTYPPAPPPEHGSSRPGSGIGPSTGRGAAGHVESTGPTDDADAEAPRWSPGRGATKKRGNGRRRPSAGR
jgi:predicted RNA-binding protein with PIN domain